MKLIHKIKPDELIRPFVLPIQDNGWIDPDLKENRYILEGQAIDENDVMCHSAKQGDRVVCHTITCGKMNRARQVVKIAGLKVKNYSLNPNVDWGHRTDTFPEGTIGNVIRIRKLIKEDIVKAWTEFLPLRIGTALYDFADQIFQAVKANWIKACSISFQPLKTEYGDPDNEDEPLYVFVESDLVSLAMCPVGLQPLALKDSIDKLGEKRFWAGFGPGQTVENFIAPNRNCIKEVNGYCITHETSLPELFKVYIDNALGFSEDSTIPEPVKRKVRTLALGLSSGECDPDETLHFDSERELNAWIGNDEIELDLVENPYANEHACRLNDPKKYDRFARKNCYKKHDGKCIDYIFGIKGGKSEVQALRYPKKVWTASAARTHCTKTGGSFEAAAESDSHQESLDRIYAEIGAIKTLAVNILSRVSKLEEQSSAGTLDRIRQRYQGRSGAGQGDRADLAEMHQGAARLFGKTKGGESK